MLGARVSAGPGEGSAQLDAFNARRFTVRNVADDPTIFLIDFFWNLFVDASLPGPDGKSANATASVELFEEYQDGPTLIRGFSLDAVGATGDRLDVRGQFEERFSFSPFESRTYEFRASINLAASALQPAVIPLPATLPLLLAGLGALVAVRRRRPA